MTATQQRSAFLDGVSPAMYHVVAKARTDAPAPAVSVVVPTHQRRDVLAAAVDALFQQDLRGRAYEIIVVDDESTDGTSEMLAAAAARSPVAFTVARLNMRGGPAVARNVGVTIARGPVVAFTDSDCVPSSGWLAACLKSFSNGTAIVQGRTTAHPAQRQPLFNHFIETQRFDGSFSTSNIAYRRDALVDAGGFDPDCAYWEDVDLGWRTTRRGWPAVFAPDALVHHQVMTLSPLGWLLHARLFHNWPAKVARYPGYRDYLFGRLWAETSVAAFELGIAGLLLARRRRAFLLLTLPYLAMFPARGRLVGRAPVLRAAAHVARDAIAALALITGSIRYRSPVL